MRQIPFLLQYWSTATRRNLLSGRPNKKYIGQIGLFLKTHTIRIRTFKFKNDFIQHHTHEQSVMDPSRLFYCLFHSKNMTRKNPSRHLLITVSAHVKDNLKTSVSDESRWGWASGPSKTTQHQFCKVTCPKQFYFLVINLLLLWLPTLIVKLMLLHRAAVGDVVSINLAINLSTNKTTITTTSLVHRHLYWPLLKVKPILAFFAH